MTRCRSDGYYMYEAILEGDWAAAKKVLERSPSLALDEISRRGDRALHLASAMGHVKIVRELLERVNTSDLAILDGRGCTACCYAAISGKVKIADLMVKKNTNLVTARDRNNATPLHKAALCGKREMVSYFLKSTKVEDFSHEEWFGIFELVVQAKMYDVALELLEKDGSLATMSNENGTALHLLARHDLSHFRFRGNVLDTHYVKRSELPDDRLLYEEVMQPDLRLLVEKLWTEIRSLDRDTVCEAMKNPPILHDAAMVGNVELITMLTEAYPNLMWERDERGHTIFHVAVFFRREVVFNLIRTREDMRHFVTTSLDENGENILHLAGKLAPPGRESVLPVPPLHMQEQLAWFKYVEKIVPPPFRETRNKDGQTPREVFSKEHERLLEKCQTWVRNTADSCMLIATIMLTLVFTAAFSVPGGNNQETGVPILLARNWFTCFLVFEAVALLGSTLSIMVFWSITTSSLEEDLFLRELPRQLKTGLAGMMISLVGSLSAFMSAYFLVFISVRGWLVKIFVILGSILVLPLIVTEVVKLFLDSNHAQYITVFVAQPTAEDMVRLLLCL